MNSVSATSRRFPSFRQWSPLGVLAGAICIIDILIPLGVAVSVLYIAVVLLSLRHRDSQLPLWTAVSCSILTIFAFFISPVGGEIWKVLANRGLAIFAIWTTTFMSRVLMQQAATIQQQDQTKLDFIRMLPSACFSFDRQGTILSWNPAAETIYGYTEQEAIGASSYDLLSTPEMLDETQRAIKAVFQGERIVNQIWHDRNKEGELGWRAGSLFPIFDNAGNIIYGININIDITAQKNAESAYQTKNALLKAILNSATDSIYAKGLDGKYLLFNKAAGEVVGRQSEAVIGLDDSEIFGPETGNLLHQLDKKLFSQGQAFTFEEQLVTHDRLSVFSTTKSPLTDADGKIIGLVGVSRDITQQKQIQHDLLQTERVFMASNDHISIVGRDYRYRRVNPSYERVHRQSGKDVVGMSVSELLGNDVFEKTVKPKLDKCFQGEEINYEAWFKFADNHHYFMSVTYLPLGSTNANIQEIVVIAKDMTERKKSEDALNLSEQRYRLLIQNAPFCIHEIDLEGRIVSMNAIGLSMLGIQTEVEILGRSYLELVDEEHYERVKVFFTQACEGKAVDFEFHVTRNNATQYYWKSFTPVRDASNHIIMVMGIAEDITERKLAEAKVAQKEEQLRTILDAMTNFVGIGTVDGTITDCNQAPLTLAGLTRKDVIGKRFTDTDWLNHSPKTQEQVRNIIQRVSQGEIVREDYQAYMGDNGMVIVDACFVPVKNAKGQIEQIVHSGIDVTERRQAENAVQQNEERFRDLYDSAPLAYFSASWDGYIIRVNARASELLGYSQKELVGKQVLTLYAPSKDGHEKASIIQKKTQEGISIQDEELEMVKKDGGILWVSLTVRLIFDESGQIIERRGMVQDISTRKKIEGELRAIEERFRTFFEAGLVGMGMISLEQTWLEVNDQLCELLGYSQKELKLKTWSELTYPDDLTQDQANFESMRAGTLSSYATSKRYIRKDGSMMYANLYVNAVRNAADQAEYFAIMIEDVTEQKQGEALLMKWAMIFQHTQWGVAVSSGNSTTLEMVNEAYARMHGYAIRELEGMSVEDVVAPEFRTEVLNTLNNIHQDGYLSYETLHLRKNNSTFPALITESAIKDINGQTLYRVMNVIDISELKSVEVALKATEERLSIALEASSSGTWDWNVLTGEVIFGKEWLSSLGYQPEDLIPTVESWENLVHPEDLPKTLQAINKHFSGETQVYESTNRLRTKNGEWRWNLDRGRVVEWTTDGKPLRMVGTDTDITTRKQVEIALQESRNRFQAIFDDAGIGMALVDVNGHFVESNRSFQSFLGYSAEELRILSFKEVTDTAHVEKNQDFFDQIRSGTQDSFNMEKRYIRKDGQIVWGHLTVTTLRHVNGEFQFAIGMIEDITKKKQSEEQLTKWANIFQHTQWGVAVGSADSHNLDLVNEAYAHMHGYSVDELQGQPIAQVFAPGFRPQLPAFIQKIHEEGFQSIESLHIRKDGSTFPALLTVSAVTDSQGVVLYRVANLIDISDRKIAEEALQQSERLANSTMNALTAHLCVLDESGQILSTNAGWNEFSRNNDGDPTKLGNGMNYVTVCTKAAEEGDEEAEFFLNGLKRVLTKQQAEFSMDYECPSPRQIRWYTARVTRFPDPGPIRVVVSHSDITEQKSLEEAIRKQNEELETAVQQRTERIIELEQRRMQVEKLAALAQIAAGVAHEINNPLASISQSLILLKRALSKDHPHYRYMAKTEDCIQRIATITKNLYQLYRPSGPLPTLVDIRKCILTAMDIMEERSTKHGVQVTGPSDSTPIMAHVAQSELIQVLCNLIHNAIDASVEGDTIDISLTTHSKSLVISVADHGEGISPEAAAHIFEPFYTTKQNGSEGGMGLGLSISYSLVDSMKGSLDFSTTLGQGSTFAITLPHT